MSVMRGRRIYVIITFILGMWMFADYFISFDPLNNTAAIIRNYVVNMQYMAVAMGLISIFYFHSKNVIERRARWYYSVWLLFVVVSVTLIGLFAGSDHPLYSFLFLNVYGTLGPSGYGIMCFFIAAAAFRVLRIRNIDSLVLVSSIVLVMLYRSPIGGTIPFIPAIGDWIQSVPSSGGMRGIIIGTAIGAIGMALRTLIGYERGHLLE